MSSDIVMGPPPPPHLPINQTPAQQQPSSKDNQDVNEKYRKLKRRYYELEEVIRPAFFAPIRYLSSFVISSQQKFKEAQRELRLSGERNVRMREEREYVVRRSPTWLARWNS